MQVTGLGAGHGGWALIICPSFVRGFGRHLAVLGGSRWVVLAGLRGPERPVRELAYDCTDGWSPGGPRSDGRLWSVMTGSKVQGVSAHTRSHWQAIAGHKRRQPAAVGQIFTAVRLARR
jgi:hypothetical protein